MAEGRRVQTFIPYYSVEESMIALARTYGGNGPANSLTHIAIQSWTPTGDGSTLGYSGEDEDQGSDEDVLLIREWARARGIRVLLCVHNNPTSLTWNWDLAYSAFVTRKDTFIPALVAEMNRLGLDGIDIDFEGLEDDHPGYPWDNDKNAFVAFIRDLKAAMGPNKYLGVNTLSYIWNGPNWTWWADLFPHVDGLNSMGYTETGINGVGWESYSAQRAQAGSAYASKLAIGLPTWVGNWLGDDLSTHLGWFAAALNTGVTLWDAQFSAPAWQTAGVWETIRGISHPDRIPGNRIGKGNGRATAFQTKSIEEGVKMLRSRRVVTVDG